MNRLPTADQLQNLPIRAVLGYAARAWRRVSSVLDGHALGEVTEEALSLVEKVLSAKNLDQMDRALFPNSAANILGTATEDGTVEQHIIWFAACAVVMAAGDTLEAARNEDALPKYAARAATRAARAARAADVLGEPHESMATAAACRDYDIMVNHFRDMDEGIVGDPIDISATGFLGPIWPNEASSK